MRDCTIIETRSEHQFINNSSKLYTTVASLGYDDHVEAVKDGDVDLSISHLTSASIKHRGYSILCIDVLYA